MHMKMGSIEAMKPDSKLASNKVSSKELNKELNKG